MSQVKIDDRYNITPSKPKKLSPNVQQGLDLSRSIVAADKLPPSLGVHVLKDSSARAFLLYGNIKVSSNTPPSTVAHELAHAIEHAHPDILRQSVTSFYDRGRGVQPKRLKSLFPAYNYRPQEITLEDKWAEKGGHVYTGKIYFPDMMSASAGSNSFHPCGAAKFFLWEFSVCWNLLLTSSVRIPNSTTSSKPSYHDFNPLRTCQNG